MPKKLLINDHKSNRPHNKGSTGEHDYKLLRLMERNRHKEREFDHKEKMKLIDPDVIEAFLICLVRLTIIYFLFKFVVQNPQVVESVSLLITFNAPYSSHLQFSRRHLAFPKAKCSCSARQNNESAP